jgi:autotransporter passenger strand-loop-strand repeat protein
VNERLLHGTVAADTVSRGGAVDVLAGVTVSGVAIRSGGQVYVSSGGVVSAATISAGTLC